MFRTSSSPLRNAVLIRLRSAILMRSNPLHIKASNAVDNVDCHEVLRSDLDLESLIRTRALAFPLDFHVKTHLARIIS